MYCKLKQGGYAIHFNENPEPNVRDYNICDNLPDNLPDERDRYYLDLAKWECNTKVYHIKEADKDLFLAYASNYETKQLMELALIEGFEDFDWNRCEIYTGEYIHANGASELCDFVRLKSSKRKEEKQYPLKFINWLHGMSDPNYTERMYQKYLKEHKLNHGENKI